MSLHCWLFFNHTGCNATMTCLHWFMFLCHLCLLIRHVCSFESLFFFFFCEARSQTCSQEEVNLLRRERETPSEKDALICLTALSRALNDIQKEIICLRWVSILFFRRIFLTWLVESVWLLFYSKWEFDC